MVVRRGSERDPEPSIYSLRYLLSVYRGVLPGDSTVPFVRLPSPFLIESVNLTGEADKVDVWRCTCVPRVHVYTVQESTGKRDSLVESRLEVKYISKSRPRRTTMKPT